MIDFGSSSERRRKRGIGGSERPWGRATVAETDETVGMGREGPHSSHDGQNAMKQGRSPCAAFAATPTRIVKQTDANWQGHLDGGWLSSGKKEGSARIFPKFSTCRQKSDRTETDMCTIERCTIMAVKSNEL